MVIGVLGGAGSVGREVAAKLRRRGHRVLVRALAAARAAGVGHWVTLSVVGAELVPMGYCPAAPHGSVSFESRLREAA